MGLFNRKGKRQGIMVCKSDDMKFEYNPSTADSTPVEEPAAASPEEEWVWVDGFKGTDKDMKATYNGFQYELGTEYSVGMSDEVRACHCGYHFCLTLQDVMKYYELEQTGFRYFKVRALVRKNDIKEYGRYHLYSLRPIDKLAAKTIILTEEITDEKTLIEAFYKNYSWEKLPEECNSSIIQKGYRRTWNEYYSKSLLNKGFSETFVNIIIDKYGKDHIERALAIADQEGVSMDMKVWFIFAGGGSSGR